MPRKKSPPSYRQHKARNCAVVTIERKNHYLGPFGSPESHAKYARLIAEWQVRRIDSSQTETRPAGTITVNDLVLAFWKFAEQRYVKNGKPTSEIKSFTRAISKSCSCVIATEPSSCETVPLPTSTPSTRLPTTPCS